MMGLSDLVYWSNLFCIGFATMGLIVFLAAVRLSFIINITYIRRDLRGKSYLLFNGRCFVLQVNFCLPIFSKDAVLTKSDPSLVLVILMVFGVSAILQNLLISVLINSRTGS